MTKTRKRVPWAGWSKQKPSAKQRTKMYKKCGKKCFLGPAEKPHPSFPICKKNTCKVSRKGVYAAFVRARQWGKRKSSYKGKSRPTMKQRTYKKVSKKAKKMLRKGKQKPKSTKHRRKNKITRSKRIRR
jgi:hypothetical protein